MVEIPYYSIIQLFNYSIIQLFNYSIIQSLLDIHLLRKLTIIPAFVYAFPGKVDGFTTEVDYHSCALPLYPIKLHQIFHHPWR